MKITKRQLRRIIKEEKARILSEQSRESVEGKLLGNFSSLIKDLKGQIFELSGLTDADGVDMGTVYGEELDATVEELLNWQDELTKHFESMDANGRRTPTEDESGIPDSKRSVIHNRRPDW